jgi:hypothetical protein
VLFVQKPFANYFSQPCAGALCENPTLDFHGPIWQKSILKITASGINPQANAPQGLKAVSYHITRGPYYEPNQSSPASEIVRGLDSSPGRVKSGWAVKQSHRAGRQLGFVANAALQKHD